MAVDGYMFFRPYKGDPYLMSESQMDVKPGKIPDPMFTQFGFNKAKDASSQGEKGALFEIEDFSFDIEQTLNIGSQSTGTGAGKVTFNPFSITRKIDKASPILFMMACSGTPFVDVRLGLRKSAGGDQSGIINLVFCFKMVAVKTISWSYDDEAPKETCTFEYGGLQIFYMDQKPDGTLNKLYPGGWNRVKNISDSVPNSDLIT
jgi:type VI secretion system secreted protein Hcp